MARPISWLPRLYEIRQSVAHSVRSHYDRNDLETLFGIRNRAAQELLKCFPTTPVGQSFLVAKEDLAQFLEEIHHAEDPASVLAARKENTQARSRRKLRVLVRKDQVVATLDSLPENLILEPGRLTITFSTSEELALALYGVAQILDEDLLEFERRYQTPRRKTPISEETLDLRRLFMELDKIERDRR